MEGNDLKDSTQANVCSTLCIQGDSVIFVQFILIFKQVSSIIKLQPYSNIKYKIIYFYLPMEMIEIDRKKLFENHPVIVKSIEFRFPPETKDDGIS